MSNEHDRAVLNAIFNPFLPTDVTVDEEIINLCDNEEETSWIKHAKELEIKGVEMAESGNFDEALNIFTEAISSAPEKASAYNNRAQVHRFKGNIEEAMNDLNTAIALSNGYGRSACQAYCQRGLIYWKKSNTEEARNDFEAAAKLGSQFAKTQLVKLNPYAALCNQMLYTVFNNLHA